MLSLFFASCGIKGDPIAPKNTELPSLLEQDYFELKNKEKDKKPSE